MPFIFSFKEHYLVRVIYLTVLLLALFWPEQWLWWVGVLLAARLGIEVVEFFMSYGCDDTLLGRSFTTGPQNETEVSFTAILLSTHFIVFTGLLLLERAFFGYVPDMARVVGLSLGLLIIAIGCFGAEMIDEVADPPPGMVDGE
jgi:phosphatidylglycerophosphate synthase